MLYQQSNYKFIFFLLGILFCETIFAQSEDTIQLQIQPIDNQLNLVPTLSSADFHPFIFNESSFYPNDVAPDVLNQFNYSNKLNSGYNRISFKQNKITERLTNLGGFEHFNNRFIYKVGSNLKFDFGAGLLKQNSVLNSYKPNFQFTFGTSLEYEINPWLSLYAYGQYLVPINNKSQKLIDPLIYMNPLFFQTEAGGGLRTKYKNIKADVGLKKIYDTQFNQSNPVNSMNTKISIGF